MAPSYLSKQRDGDYYLMIGKSFLAGGMAGMCAKSTVAPLDRIKILLQAQSTHYKQEGVFSGLRKIIHNEGYKALYNGNGAQMVRIFPYAATQFTAFEFYKEGLRKTLGKENESWVSGVAGSCAGVTAVFLTYPLDCVRARLSFQVMDQRKYNGIFHAIRTIYLQEGMRAFYKGFWATVCGMVPYAGLSFYTFEKMKYICMKYFPDKTCAHNDQMSGMVLPPSGLELKVPARLVSGGLAGAISQSFSYPFDVTRRRMQLSGMCETTKRFGNNMFSTLYLVYKEDGIIRGLYRGMTINYMRAIPMTAVSFTVYETMKNVLGLDTGLKIKVLAVCDWSAGILYIGQGFTPPRFLQQTAYKWAEHVIDHFIY